MPWAALGVALAPGLLAAPLAADAQQPERTFKIGVLATTHGRPWDLFRGRLTELGYVDGRNVTIEWRYTEGGFVRGLVLGPNGGP